MSQRYIFFSSKKNQQFLIHTFPNQYLPPPLFPPLPPSPPPSPPKKTKVRSIHLDDWLPETVDVMRTIGNLEANQMWELHLPGPEHKPTEGSTREVSIDLSMSIYIIILCVGLLSICAQGNLEANQMWELHFPCPEHKPTEGRGCFYVSIYLT